MQRPLLSVMIPVYNPPAGYFREALQSVLTQDCGPYVMQIEVVDNCSDSEEPERIVRELGKGRIDFYRQAHNVGAIENFNTCIRRARGHWIHIHHADDTVLPNFYTRASSAIAQHPHAGAIAAQTILIDERGNWIGLSELERPTPGILDREFVWRLLADQRLSGGIVVRRSTYEEIGAYRRDLPYCADWDMWKRIAVRYPIYYDPKPLACYRIHHASLTSDFIRYGRNVADERRSIEIAQSYVKYEDRSHMRRTASRAVAIKAIRNSKSLWRAQHYSIAIRQVWEASRTSLAPGVLIRLAQLLAWIMYHSMSAPRPSPRAHGALQPRDEALDRGHSRG